MKPRSFILLLVPIITAWCRWSCKPPGDPFPLTPERGVYKQRITIFNNASEGILVSIDQKIRRPLKRSFIASNEARYFFLPELTPRQPYYMVIENSAEGGTKIFTISLDPTEEHVFLYRDGYEISHESWLESYDGIELFYYGILQPAVPELSFKRRDIMVPKRRAV